jgi:hypothetical protein
MTSVPYLSVIGWVRNDGYMDGYAERIRRAIRFLITQLNRHKVPSEIVLVDWNPPSDRPLMADVLGELNDGGYVSVRFIIVDGRYHRPLIGSEFKGMHVLNAANAGLRRARGKFVVPKAIDTFFTESLIAQIARQDLKTNEVYRCDRYDVEFDADWLEWSDEELLERMSAAVMRRHERLVQSPEWGMRDLHTNACGDFTLMAASHWHEIRGYQYDPTVLCLDADSIALHAAAAHGVHEVCWPDDCRIYKVTHNNVFVRRISEEWKDWQRQLDLFVTKRFSPEMRIKMRMLLDYPRRRVRGIDGIIGPSIERNFVMKARRYARSDTSLVTNRDDWGLAYERLAERTTMRAGWDHARD